jgi:hypothetical protein
MPGPFVHLSAMRATTAALTFRRGSFHPPEGKRINPDWKGADTRALGGVMQAHPNFAGLGAIGPDLFFFLPDFRDVSGLPLSSALVQVLKFLEGLYEALDPYVEKYNEYLGPITENAGEQMSRLTGGLSESVGNIVGELGDILIAAIEGFVTEQMDLFEYFSLGHNRGWDEQAFLWSDMLHYRRTGKFGRALVTTALSFKDDSDRHKALAYAMGYLTHVATDVTGHAFVNSIAGGPFRLHWQRHHLVENHMDAFRYLSDPLRPGSGAQYPQVTESALYYDIAFSEEDGSPVARPAYPEGNTLRDNWTRRRLLDLDSELAAPIPELLYQAITQVFYADGGKHPKILRDDNGKPTTELIEETYRLLFRYLKMTTVDGFSHEPPEPPDVFPNLDFPTFNDPGSHDAAPGGDDDDSDWWDDLLDFLLSVVKTILYLIEVAIYLATLPWAILADLITYPLRLGLYYALELPLFHIFKNFRAVLVMTGYLLPMDDEIAVGLVHVGAPDPGAFRNLLDDAGDVFGGVGENLLERMPFRDAKFPRLTAFEEFKAPWKYPAHEAPELVRTVAGPYARFSDPNVLFGNVPTNADIRDRLEDAKNQKDANDVGDDLRTDRHLGDAISFSSYLIWLDSRDSPQPDGTQPPLVDWNLDADRGYGHHCWDWNRRKDSTFPDPEGLPYNAPCTWPTQAEDGTFDPGVPLQIHWAEFADPGCEKPPREPKKDPEPPAPRRGGGIK